VSCDAANAGERQLVAAARTSSSRNQTFNSYAALESMLGPSWRVG
jgi:hypothetical protein